MRFLVLIIFGIIGFEQVLPLSALAKENAQPKQNQERAAQQSAEHQAAAREVQERQQQARAQQEQMVRAQEEQARKSQTQALKAQQEEARRAQKAEQEESRRGEEQAQKEQLKEQQKEQQKEARRAEEQAQEQQKEQQKEARKTQEIQESKRPESREQLLPNDMHKVATAIGPRDFVVATRRPATPRPLSLSTVPIAKAVPQPVLEANIDPNEKEHARTVAQNLQAHLIAVSANQAPRNAAPVASYWSNNYYNNYPTVVNNQRIFINRQNTVVSYFQPNEYPTWYQPQPYWALSNGFTLGNLIHCGLDWLRWGWHPYYGPPPEGFVCAQDYFPTPWVYIPAYGLWRQPGAFSYSDTGPPFDYTGPITVEILEPRHIHIRDPYTGWMSDRVINVMYFYNAFYYPEYDRWGYMNRHGYFIWINPLPPLNTYDGAYGDSIRPAPGEEP